MDTAKFVPFTTSVTPSFWYKLVDLKLNKYKLSDSSVALKGSYTNIVSLEENRPCQHEIDFDAFSDQLESSDGFMTHGTLLNKNTIEDFKTSDKKLLLKGIGEKLWGHITNGDAIEDPSLLAQFVLLTFADLKKYNFYYWFGYPAFLQSNTYIVTKTSTFGETYPSYETCLVSELKKLTKEKRLQYFLIVLHDNFVVSMHKLIEFKSLRERHSSQNIIFGFGDPSPMQEYPGWPLRNYLTLISYHWASSLDKIQILCTKIISKSSVQSYNNSYHEISCNRGGASDMPEVTGWEKNAQGKLGPKYVNLSENMDPYKLAESSTTLNLRLMKWRLLPNIDLEKIAEMKCLLLGAGTLGCNISRALLAWGVKHITFVDNGKVSFSNPVRQTLYEFVDCKVTGGVLKATAAAEKLKRIHPGVVSEGFVLSIPMPGHPINSSEKYQCQAIKDTTKIIDLIKQHDVVFLLTDSRESRWLPTVIASAESKLVITTALGFDSYLVMRHGIEAEQKLGCYFCNDVVAPGNSLKDRTLDQQCTVSRPGLSLIASALAVELCVSVLQHPEKGCFYHSSNSKELSRNEDPSEFPLGIIPHQIRGFLSQYETLLLTTFSFSKCTACSLCIIEAYKQRGIDFLIEVFNSSGNYLEDLTGLTALHEEAAFVESDILEFSDNESI